MLYGGQNDEKVFNDLWIYDNNKYLWKNIDVLNKKLKGARKGHSSSLYLNKTEEVSETYENVNEIISRFNLILFGGSNGTSYMNDILIIDIKHNQIEDKMLFEYRSPKVIGDIPEPREVKILLNYNLIYYFNFYRDIKH
jgi:hypothetical protein